MNESTFNTIPDYIFASPRYNTVKNLDTTLIPEDYRHYDNLNGTMDKYFPLYALTSNQQPKIILIKENGESVDVTGFYNFKALSDKYSYRELGKKANTTSLANSNLDYKKVWLKKYINPKLTPGWSLIQVNTKIESDITYSFPQFIIRALGNNTSIRYNLAVKLEKPGTLNTALEEFPVGIIVEYNGNLWKCISSTKSYPPLVAPENQQEDVPTSTEWDCLRLTDNVFNADVSVLANGKTVYMAEINDYTRRFNPNLPDDTLVCWNLSYTH